MADNYLEKQYDEYQASKARREHRERLKWQKQLREYRKSLSNPPSTPGKK